VAAGVLADDGVPPRIDPEGHLGLVEARRRAELGAPRDGRRAWCHEFDGGRSFYTALGHTDESYSDPLFLAHVAGGIEWELAR
jgi:hypothetical protein